MSEPLSVSVVIPTHNRAASLERTLLALSRQDYPSSLLQVIVVGDGCTDRTPELIEELSPDYKLVFLPQANLGPGGARNAGAERASGDLLIFLDDDIEASKGFVSAHVLAHRRSRVKDLVVVGYLPARLSLQSGFYRAALIHWWEAMFDAMGEPGHRFRYVDLLSGNFSIPRALFAQVEGFDANLRCHEDYELGLRLIKAGAAFGFARDAWGHHHEISDLARSVSRKFAEGRADIVLAQKHPDLIPQLPLMRTGRSTERCKRWAFQGRVAPLVHWVCERGGRAAEALRMRTIWRRFAYGRFELAYWQGVAETVGDLQALQQVIASAPEPAPAEPLPELDLAEGLEEAEAWLDAARPAGVVVRYGCEQIGVLGAENLRERLHAGHLRPWLAKHQVYPLLVAMAMSQAQSAALVPATGGPDSGSGGPPRGGPMRSRVSIVIPAHDAAATLAATLDSVLAQTHADWEAIVVDDASTDATAAVIEAYAQRDARFKPVRANARSAGGARNAGLELARGDWILFLDADDTIDPLMLDRMLAALRADPQADAAHCGWRYVAAGRTIASDRCRLTGDLFEVLAYRAPFAIHACLVSRAAVAAAGGFDPSLKTCEDHDLWQRIARNGARFAAVPDTLATYNLREDQTWFHADAWLRDILTVLGRGHATPPGVARAGAPKADLAMRAFHILLYAGGMSVARAGAFADLTERATGFLRDAGVAPAAPLDPETCADILLEAAPMALRRERSAWPELWEALRSPLSHLLLGVEQACGFKGLQRATLRALERKVAAFLPETGRVGGVVRAVIDAERPIEAIACPEAHTLFATVVCAGRPLGVVRLPVCDGWVAPEVVADAVAGEFGWPLLGLFFARHLYPTERPDAAADDPALHDEIGWRALLGEVWPLSPSELDQLYAPLPALPEDLPQHPPEHALSLLKVGEPWAALPTDNAAEPILYRLGREAQAAFWVPAQDGKITPARAAAVFTQQAGFDLVRLVAREAIVGRSLDEPTSLRERLLSAGGGHEDADDRVALGRWPWLDAGVWPRFGSLPAAAIGDLSTL
jgi:glycosyltransferase involved in cell wall biosynthesis